MAVRFYYYCLPRVVGMSRRKGYLPSWMSHNNQAAAAVTRPRARDGDLLKLHGRHFTYSSTTTWWARDVYPYLGRFVPFSDKEAEAQRDWAPSGPRGGSRRNWNSNPALSSRKATFSTTGREQPITESLYLLLGQLGAFRTVSCRLTRRKRLRGVSGFLFRFPQVLPCSPSTPGSVHTVLGDCFGAEKPPDFISLSRERFNKITSYYVPVHKLTSLPLCFLLVPFSPASVDHVAPLHSSHTDSLPGPQVQALVLVAPQAFTQPSVAH